MNQCTSLLAHGGKAFSQRYYFFFNFVFPLHSCYYGCLFHSDLKNLGDEKTFIHLGVAWGVEDENSFLSVLCLRQEREFLYLYCYVLYKV